MMNKLMASFLLLLLAACDGDQPRAPRLEGQWQCRNGIAITFSGPQNYTVTSPAGESAGVYKLTVGENNYHRIEWNILTQERDIIFTTLWIAQMS